MLSRRTVCALLAGSVSAPALSFAQGGDAKTAFYSGVWSDFTRYDIDFDAMTLARRNTVKLPGGVQYAWPHPSRRFLYVTTSTGGPGMSGNSHHACAFSVDGSGDLTPHGEALALRSRPIHHSVDRSGQFLLIAHNDPSGLSVHRIKPDGMIGDEIKQSDKLDFGIYGHQILATPSNQSLIMVARGNNATAKTSEDPGALKAYGFKDGVVTNKASVAPGTGLGFGPRHLDFHPTQPWVYVSVERQNKLSVYGLQSDGGLSAEPLFVKATLPGIDKHISSAGPIHVHPNGRFVYLTNRGGWTSSPPPGSEVHNGMRVFDATNSNIAVFAIDQQTGEPTLIQNIDLEGAHPRTFSIDAKARMLVAGNLVPVALRRDGEVTVVPAGLSVFRMANDGKLEFVRKYDVDTGKLTQWWTGMIALA